MNIEAAYHYLLLGTVIVLGLLVVLGLIRAILGPKVADRIVAINMIGTLTITVIAVLAVMIGEEYLVDICLIYAMISFLAVVVLSKVYMGAYQEAKLKAQNKENEEKEGEKHGVD